MATNNFLEPSDLYKYNGVLAMTIVVACTNADCLVTQSLWSRDYADVIDPHFPFPSYADLHALAHEKGWAVIISDMQSEPMYLCPTHSVPLFKKGV